MFVPVTAGDHPAARHPVRETIVRWLIARAMGIHKGDGTGLSANGFSEIRKGDGTVLWSTSGVGVVDDFEDGDISEYSGDTGGFTVQSGTVLEGAETLESGRAATGGDSIASTSGLPRYPASGDTFRCTFRTNFLGSATNGSTISAFGFASQSATSLPNGYEIWAQADGNIELLRRGGSTLDTAAVSLSDDTTYEWLIDWGNPITVSLRDSGDSELASLSGSDSTYSGGGIMFWNNVSSADDGTTRTSWWDNVRIV